MLTLFGVPIVQWTLLAVITTCAYFLARNFVIFTWLVLMLVPVLALGFSMGSANAGTVISASENQTPPSSGNLTATQPSVVLAYLVNGMTISKADKRKAY